MTPLRLLYVTARAPLGRDETFVMEELRALLRRGHFVRIVPLLPRGGRVHGLSRDLLPATDCCSPWSRAVLGAAWREFAAAPWRCLGALALLLTWQPRNLLANLFVYPKALWLARRARELEIEHIHAHWATTTSAMAMAAARVAGLPWSFTAHGYDLHRNDLFARKVRHAEFARVICRDGERLARQNCAARPLTPTLSPRKIVRVPMGVVVPATVGVGRPTATPRLLCPARMVTLKGHRTLLRAFAKVTPPAELWLAGDGLEREAIEYEIRALGLDDKVRVLGYLRNEHLLELYRRRVVDAVILASTREGIPVALMEAMAAGVPAIATGVGGIPELLWGGAGMLVPPGDAPALTWAIEELLRDPALRARLGATGRARIARRFSIDRTAQLLEACFAGQNRTLAGILKRTKAPYRPAYAAPTRVNPVISARSARHHATAQITPPTTRGPT